MTLFKREIASINAAALLIGAAGFLSDILGLFRDRLLAGHFGASRELDIYYAAFQIPDLLFTLFLVGAATAAIIPVFLEVKEKDPDEAKRLIESLFNAFLLVSAAFCLLVIFFAPLIFKFLVPGFSPEERSLTVLMTRIMMASPFLLSLSNIISSVIQANRRFATFALSPICYNIGIIFGILVFLPAFGLPGLAYGVILGAFLHLLVQIPTFMSLGFRIRPALRMHSAIKKILSLSVPRVLSLSMVSITVLIVNAIASTLIPGSIAVFQFARNLESIPIGIIGVSFAVAVFPRLSGAFVKKDGNDFYESFFGTLETVIFWLAPIAVLMYVLRAHIVRLALGTGRFDWSDTRLTAAVFGIFCFSVILESILPLIIKGYYALNKTSRPLIINFAASGSIVVLSFALARVFSDPSAAFPAFVAHILKVDDVKSVGILGLALAIAIGEFIDFIFLFRFFLKEGKETFGFVPKNGFLKETVFLIAVAVLSGFVAYGARLFLNLFISLDTFFGVFFQALGSGVAGVIVYGAILYWKKNSQLLGIIEVFRRRLLKPDVLPSELGS
ncbi:MAG: murein biosynthesis integral membrane protein MurJ [Candidatus Sungbacteria bacterium RIFCSPLOWO2_01_FULL_47_32]|uniref:Probable lipid II flippase MurJ n=1 Tax=Candidatus Sungbacteria bacterium RIFCSPHIGHO2_01_FULL_47_32 TaxID=1802264 RepID=A0A1G2K3T3_9BACT|nr:MAG: murein biosynthesis integral membrane protein MurJ [Candidatus Sungbacteria bacterium RIFCSPHIGHO2_01_FULL_47_32]OGZ98503.1 MAG: murein biosynthesis integral membrane protein MurJ [Candidatus Sungbacteria bacterium RIFCSPHIGHO2_02_FULL_46_12]OHA05296.1 MAG: murein biosynthesis integral membrane protein MurJ [Candidatus Sungbacteria bacterium RIFCSPLOWO2_01_FULL_47_32]